MLTLIVTYINGNANCEKQVSFSLMDFLNLLLSQHEHQEKTMRRLQVKGEEKWETPKLRRALLLFHARSIKKSR